MLNLKFEIFISLKKMLHVKIEIKNVSYYFKSKKNESFKENVNTTIASLVQSIMWVRLQSNPMVKVTNQRWYFLDKDLNIMV